MMRWTQEREPLLRTRSMRRCRTRSCGPAWRTIYADTALPRERTSKSRPDWSLPARERGWNHGYARRKDLSASARNHPVKRDMTSLV